MPSSRRFSQPMYWTQVSCIAGYFTLELKGSPFILYPLVNIFLQVYQQLNWHLCDIVRSQITKDQFSAGQILVVLEKTFESPLNCKEIQPVNPKGNQFWIFIGRTDAEAETPVLWPPDVKNWLIGKDLDAGKDWRLENKRMTEDEMVGWHHWLDGLESEQALGVGMDREAWRATVYGVTKSLTWLSNLNWLNWTIILLGDKRKEIQNEAGLSPKKLCPSEPFHIWVCHV